MNELESAVREVAETLHTGTPPGKPPSPFVPRFLTGSVTAVGNSGCTVDFDDGTPIAGIPWMNDQPVAGDVVLVVQLPHQRLIVGVLSHTPWTNVTFVNGWSNYGGGYFGVQYRKEASGVVALRGMATGGTMGTTVFTLPTGFRPSSHVLQTAVANAVPTWVQVQNSGAVVVSAGFGSNAWLSFDNIRIPLQP